MLTKYTGRIEFVATQADFARATPRLQSSGILSITNPAAKATIPLPPDAAKQNYQKQPTPEVVLKEHLG